MKKLAFIILISTLQITAQNVGGLLLDEKYYRDAPKAAKLMRGDYERLPASVSLKKYSPTAGDQGAYSTCAGWASSYNARTILEAMRFNWDQSTIDKNTFSPYFIYNQIRTSKDCYGGTSLDDALKVLKEVGDVKTSYFKNDCSRQISEVDKQTALDYKIMEYRFLAYRDTANIIKYIKKSLAEGKPVVIGMEVAPSFQSLTSGLWKPNTDEYRSWRDRGHALTVIGYDDQKYNGAFEILNSWGTMWGDKGFVWITYSDFKFFYMLAYEVIDKRAIDTNAVDLSGMLKFTESNGKEMKVKFNGSYFETLEPYPSGTLFDLRISNNEPAYVYALGSDLTNKVTKLFPNAEKVLSYLAYRQNNVAIPDEDSWNILDSTTGKTYYCFLYSRQNLEITEIIRDIEKSNGSFPERVSKVLSDQKVPDNDINFESGSSISFSAKSKNKILVPIIIEINHQ